MKAGVSNEPCAVVIRPARARVCRVRFNNSNEKLSGIRQRLSCLLGGIASKHLSVPTLACTFAEVATGESRVYDGVRLDDRTIAVDLLLAAAYWRLGLLAAEDLPEIASQGLESGMDSPSLRILAGEQHCSMATCKLLFERSLRELRIAMPAHDEAGFRIAKRYAQQIVSGQLTPREGAGRIWSEIELNEEHEGEFARLRIFTGLASEHEDLTDGSVTLDQARKDYYTNLVLECEQQIVEEASKLIAE